MGKVDIFCPRMAQAHSLLWLDGCAFALRQSPAIGFVFVVGAFLYVCFALFLNFLRCMAVFIWAIMHLKRFSFNLVQT